MTRAFAKSFALFHVRPRCAHINCDQHATLRLTRPGLPIDIHLCQDHFRKLKLLTYTVDARVLKLEFLDQVISTFNVK